VIIFGGPDENKGGVMKNRLRPHSVLACRPIIGPDLMLDLGRIGRSNGQETIHCGTNHHKVAGS
jgi:hypothetical protein